MKDLQLINKIHSILSEVAQIDTDTITDSDLTGMLDWRAEVIINTVKEAIK